MDQVRREAARRGETITSLIEQGLRVVLLQSQKSERAHSVNLPVAQETGGTLPGIDINNNADLLDKLGGLR